MSRRTVQHLELSSPQREVWFGQLVHPEAPVYVIGGYVRLEGPIDPARFRQAIEMTVRRHDALRTILHDGGALPAVECRERIDVPLEQVDVSAEPDPEQAADAWIGRAFQAPFPLYGHPLFHFALVRLGAGRWRWLLKYQHTIVDGWAIALVVQDVARAYGCLAEGRAPDWEPAPSYREFVRDDRAYLDSEACRRDAAYWRDRFRDLPPQTVPRRHAVAMVNGAVPSGISRLVLPRAFYDRLGQSAAEADASIVHVLLAAIYICFTRTSGHDDLVVGLLSLNRRTAAFKRTVGMFTTVLPARLAFGRDRSVRELVQAIAAALRRDYRHQRYPIAGITRAAGLPQPGRPQLFDITLSYEKHSHDATFEGRPARTIGLSNGYEQNALAIFVRELHAEGDVDLDLHYSLAAFDAGEIALVGQRLVFVLEQMLQDGGRSVSEIDVMPPAEVDRAIHAVNRTGRDIPADDTIVSVVERQVRQSGGRPALRAGGQALDYAALNARANRLARRLRARGIGPEQLVGLCLERSADLVVAMLAVLKAGAAFVPLDPAYPAARRAMVVSDAGPAVVVTHRGLWLAQGDEGVAVLDLDADRSGIDGERGDDLGLATPASALAYVNYTSGSTGRPKGVMVSHANVVNFFAAMDACLGERPATWLALTSISFDISVLELLWTLSRGSTVVIGGSPLDVVSSVPAAPPRARDIELSLFYFASDERAETAGKYRLLLDGARFADEHGFAAVWTPERHFHPFGGLYPNPSVTAAAIAAVTSRIQVRAGSVVLPLHHPVRVAEEWAVVDNLSGGRVGLSFASGWQERDFVLAPDRYDGRKEAMARDIDLVRRLWRGETVTLAGPGGQPVDVRTLPRPVQDELPIWITAAGDPATFERAGELGANLLTHLLGQHAEELARKIAIYREACRRTSGRDGHVTLMLHAFAGPSRAATLEAVREPFRAYLRSSVSLMANVARSLGIDMESAGFQDEDLEALLDHAFERYASSSALFGTPDECRDRLDRLAAIGVDEAALLIDFGVPAEAVMESLARFAGLTTGRRPGSEEESFETLIHRHGVTHLQCTPSMARLLLAQPAAHAALRALECLVVGGEELPHPLARALQQDGPVRLYNMYGPTETTVWSMCQPIADGAASVPIGTPVANTQVYLLDDRMAPVPIGSRGELYIGGAGVARGYLGQPDRTAERFVPDPFGPVPGGRLYRTGDLAVLRPEGVFEFVGRADDQVKIRGHRVEPGEVEAVLRQHPAVAHAVVVAADGPDGERRLVACLVPRPGPRPGPADLHRFAESRLPAAFVPSAWVIERALPLTPNGKVDRRALERLAGTLPDQPVVAPPLAGGPEEEILAEIWHELLGHRPSGPGDSFFESGGHSLLAMLLAQRIRTLFGVDVSLRQLFESPTLGGLAARIRARRAPGRSTREGAPMLPSTGGRTLSFAQQRLWFLEQLTPGRSTYVVPALLRLSGPLNVDALRTSLAGVLRRHEVLRTRYPAVGGEPVVIVDDEVAVDLPLVDLSGEADPEAAMQELAGREARRPFDLASGPVLRSRLFRVAPDVHGLLLSVHHIVSDGYWSLAIVMRDLSAAYDALVEGRSAPADQPALQYADYAAWQQRRRRAGAFDASLAYWRQQLHGCPPAIELPADRPRPLLQSGRGDEVALDVPAALGPAARALAQACGGTLFMTLSACLGVLLARFTHQTDLVIGTAIANRTEPELQDLVGLFVNTLPLRIDASGDPSFADLVDRVRRTCLDAYDHSEVPFELIVEGAAPDRELGRSPLFQVMLVLQTVPAGPLEMSGLQVDPIHLSTGSAKFDLIWTFEEHDGRLRGLVEYNADIFDRTTVERLGESFLALLEGATTGPDAPISTLPVMTPAQRRHLRQLGSGGDLPSASDDRPVHWWFEQAARATPDRVALVCRDRHWTYDELNRRANQLARLLRDRGIGGDAGVGLFLEPSPLQVVSLLAVLKAGGFFLPLDPAYPAPRLAFMIEDARPSIVVTDGGLQDRLPAGSPPVLRLDLDDPRLAAQRDDDLGVEVLPDQLAYIIYTSGSTGRPRGVTIAHRAIANHMIWLRDAFPLDPHDRVLQRTPFSFDASIWEFLAPLMQGARLVVADAESRLDPARLARAIRDAGVTTLQMVPSLLATIADEPAFGQATSLRTVFAGGEPLDAALVQRLKARLPVQVVNLYGPTEACIDVTAWVDDGSGWGTLPIGRPIRHTRAYVLDDRMELVPAGVEGDLYVGGAGLARGYLDLPDLTADRFVPDPFGPVPGARLYRTGDRARMRADGVLEFLGRHDRQVKIRGCRIEVGEVEAALRRAAGLEDVRVQARLVHGEPQLVAYVAGGRGVDPAAVRTALSAALPSYMVPAHVITVPSWPILPNGKLDWNALPAPGAPSTAGGPGYAAPRNALEEAIAAIFAEVLAVERVGVHDGFFELGGHSLKATRAIARARDHGIELSLSDLFRHGSPAALANAIVDRRFGRPDAIRADGTGPARGSAVTPVAPAPDYPVSHGQRRLWVLEHFGEGRPYHMAGALEILGDLDVDGLEEAFRAVIARHESLRTQIVEVNGEPRQRIATHADFTLTRIDLTGASDWAARLDERAAVFFHQPFDLARDLLLRVAVATVAPSRAILLFCQHHVISDGWSIGVMVREILACYAARREGHPWAPLPLAFHYKDYTAWQQGRLDADEGAADRRYWLAALADPVEPLRLPLDFPAPRVRPHTGRHFRFRIDRETAGGLRALARSTGGTGFTALLSAVQVLLYRYTSQREMMLGVAVAGREGAGFDEQIGFYANLLPVRLAVHPAQGFEALMAATGERVTAALDHQTYPFDRLVDELALPVDPSRSPLFDVVVVMQTHDAPALDLPGSTVRDWPVETGMAKFGLTFEFAEADGGIDGVLEYNTAWFAPATAERMVRHLQALIASAQREPGRAVSDLAMERPRAGRSSESSGGGARPSMDAGEPLIRRFEAHVVRRPEAVAIVDGDHRITYAELDARAAHLARRLTEDYGVGPETLVALLAPRGASAIVGLLGIQKAGGAYLPLDPRDPADRIARLVERSAATVVVCGGDLHPPVPDGVRIVRLDDRASPALDGRVGPSTARIDPQHLAYVIYTSGSTGEPKGVEVTQANVSRLFDTTQAAFAFGRDDVWAWFHSLAFDFSVWEIWGALAHGGRLVIVEHETSRSPDRLVDLLAREGVTVLNQTPTAFAGLSEALARQPGRRLALRWLVFGGEALRPRMLDAWWTFDVSRAARVVNMYGITETTVHATRREMRNGEALAAGVSPIGVPLDDLRIHLLDESMNPVPTGVPGELYVAGPGVARGYRGDAGRTAERFVPDPFAADGGRLYRTGDLGRRGDDGTLEYLGRNDRQCKIRGFRIEPGEIEAELRRHPSIADALVRPQEAPGGPELAAWLVSDDRELTIDAIRRHLDRRLPPHMVPARFARIDRWPLTSNGKIDMGALPAPGAAGLAAGVTFVAPATPVERTLAALWLEVLGTDRIGAGDDFFALGGHSVSAIRVIQGIRASLGCAVSLTVLFEHPILRDLAIHLEGLVPGPPAGGGRGASEGERIERRRDRRTVSQAGGEAGLE
ncbi:MAG: amino acid adenylation domain-containing protein [Acidobacteriota bacterium]|nr:amino acid adenylation domain-containing protein [Acidobacteriota bacterium]